MAKDYEVLGKVEIPEEHMKGLIWVDRQAGEVRAKPFGNRALTPQEIARRAKEKEANKKARETARIERNEKKAEEAEAKAGAARERAEERANTLEAKAKELRQKIRR